MASRRQDGVRFAAPAGACRPINRQTSRGWKAAYFAGVPAERGRVLVRRAPLELWASMENWHLPDTPSGEKKNSSTPQLTASACHSLSFGGGKSRLRNAPCIRMGVKRIFVLRQALADLQSRCRFIQNRSLARLSQTF